MVQLFASLTGSFPKGTSPVTLNGAQIDKITWLYDKSTEVRAAINALLVRITGGSVRLIEPKINGQENERLMTTQLKNLAKQVTDSTVQFILDSMMTTQIGNGAVYSLWYVCRPGARRQVVPTCTFAGGFHHRAGL